MELDAHRISFASTTTGCSRPAAPTAASSKARCASTEAGAIVSSRETAYKVRNLRRDRWAQACVFTERFFGRWIFFEGRAEVLSLPDAMELLIDYYKRFPGREPGLERLPRPDGA